MKKTLNINLGGSIFNLEEDAYEKLKAYLDAINKYFSAYEENLEVVEDIESRFAEQFSAKLSKNKQVITLADVEELIKIIGRVEDITNTQTASSTEPPSSASLRQRKLFRDTGNKIIAGVCSGLAAYFNLDAVLIRLLFFVSIFFGGSGIFIYAILWFIMPEAKTAVDQTEMQGYAVTLESLEKTIKEKISSPEKKEEGRLMRLILLPFRLLGKIIDFFFIVVKKVLPILSAILGTLIFIGAVSGIALVCFGLAELVFNNASPYFDFPAAVLFPENNLYLIATAVLFSIILPGFFLVLTGVSLVRRKLTFNAITVLTLLALWIVSLTAFGFLSVKAIPIYQEKIAAANNMPNITIESKFKNFNQINAQGDFSLDIKQGREFKINATGQEKDLDNLVLSVNNGILTIEKKQREKKLCFLCFEEKRIITVEIILPALNTLKATNNNRISLSGFKQKDQQVSLSGIHSTKIESQIQNLELIADSSSQLSLTGSADNLKVNINDVYQFNLIDFSVKNIDLTANSSSKILLTGSAENLTANFNSLYQFDAFGFPTKSATLTVDQVSETRIWATEKLTISGTDYGHIYYKGDPTITSNLESTRRFYKATMTQQPNGLEMKFEPAFPESEDSSQL